MLGDGAEIPPVPQRRQLHAHSVQAIIQVGPEPPVPHRIVKRRVRRRDQQHIHLTGTAAADRAHHPVIEQAQQHGLKRERHIANLVQEQSAAIGLADQAGRAAAPRTCESALDMAEQFRLDQRIGQRGAVYRHEGARPLAYLMGVTCKLFLASAGLAFDQDRQHARRPRRDLAKYRHHRRIPRHERWGERRTRCHSLGLG